MLLPNGNVESSALRLRGAVTERSCLVLIFHNVLENLLDDLCWETQEAGSACKGRTHHAFGLGVI